MYESIFFIVMMVMCYIQVTGVDLASSCSVCPDITTQPGCDDGCEPGDLTTMMTAACGGKCEGSTCLAEGAMVLMGDGIAREVESLDVNDRVAGIDPGGIAREQVIQKVTRAWGRLLEVVHGEGSFFCTHSHVVFTHDGSAIRADELEPGVHRLAAPDGEPIDIVEVKGGGEGIVIALEVSPDHVFMAEGVRHHNKIIPPGP